MKDNAGHRLQDGRYHPGSERSRNSQEHPDEGPLNVEPVVVIIGNHIFRPGNYKVLVMAKPDAVQYNGVEPVYHHPQGVRGKASAPERGTAIDVSYQQAQQDAEDGHSCQFLRVEADTPRLVTGIHQSQLIATLNDGRRVVEYGLYRVPGHQEHHQRKQGAGYEGFKEKDHFLLIYLENDFSRRV